MQVLEDLYAFRHGEFRAWMLYTELQSELSSGKKYDLPSPSIDRNGPALVNFQNKFIFLSGDMKAETMDWVECYSIQKNVWFQAPRL